MADHRKSALSMNRQRRGFPSWVATAGMCGLGITAVAAAIRYLDFAEKRGVEAGHCLLAMAACFGLILWGSTRKTD